MVAQMTRRDMALAALTSSIWGFAMAIAFAGLALIGLTIGSDLKVAALGLALGGALSWAVGNVLVKHAAGVPTFPLVVWSSLIPPVPALIVSGVSDQRSLLAAI